MPTIRRPLPTLSLLALTLAGCATHRGPAAVADVAPPPVAVVAGPPLPAGATEGMMVPQRQPDGSFPTPNQGLTGAAAIWHLRSGLNVAALSCPGAEGATIRAGYNAWLKRDKAPLARAATGYAAQYRGRPVAEGYDGAMTRLYNFFAQTPVRPGLCTAAAGILAEAPGVAPAALAIFAQSRLPLLDQPYLDFYAAYDAWRDGRAGRTVIAAAAVTPPTPFAAPVATTPVAIAAAAPSRRTPLTLDLSTLPADTAVTAAR